MFSIIPKRYFCVCACTGPSPMCVSYLVARPKVPLSKSKKGTEQRVIKAKINEPSFLFEQTVNSKEKVRCWKDILVC